MSITLDPGFGFQYNAKASECSVAFKKMIHILSANYIYLRIPFAVKRFSSFANMDNWSGFRSGKNFVRVASIQESD